MGLDLIGTITVGALILAGILISGVLAVILYKAYIASEKTQKITCDDSDVEITCDDSDVEEPNRCDICGGITFTFTDAFCQKCFRKRRVIYVILTIIVSLAVSFVAVFGSSIVGELALGLDMISEAELEYTMVMSYNIICIVLILIYKFIMMKYVKSATVFVPSVLLFLFLYKTPKKSDKNNKVCGIERAAIK